MTTELIETKTTAEKALLECNTETPPDTVAAMNLIVDGFAAYARDVAKQRDEFMREYVMARGRVKKDSDPSDPDMALVVGTTLYTIQHPEKVKCPPERRSQAMRGIEDACDGDLEQVESLYSSDWFKQGSIRKVFKSKFGDEDGEKRFRELFVVTREAKLEKDGTPSAKKLEKTELLYLRR